MNYGEVVNQIRDLGFGDTDEIEEFDTIVPYAINRAITDISLNYAPIIKSMGIDHPFDGMKLKDWQEQHYDESLYEYPMPDDFMKFADIPVKKELQAKYLTDDNGDYVFDAKGNRIVEERGIYQRFGNYEIEGGDTIILGGDCIGHFEVFYVADHEPFSLGSDVDLDEQNEREIPLPRKAHYLLPLLASYYVWLDDDQFKAQEYYTRYQQALQTALEETKKPRAKVVDWGGTV